MPHFSFQFEAIGTFFEIDTPRELRSQERKDILDYIEAFDVTFSRFRADSLVCAMARNAGTYTFPSESEPLFAFYEELYVHTSGKVTPLIGGSLEAMGYDATYSFRNTNAVTAPAYTNVVSRDKTTITISQPVIFDVGAAGKGFLVDRIGALLKKNAISAYTIDASGDILHKGKKPEHIGLEDPLNQGKVIGSIELQNEALCASATNRRRWGEGLHHIIDPDTGLPTTDVLATWVTADSTMKADGLATALFFTSPDTLKNAYTYEYMCVRVNKTIDFSAGFSDTLFKEQL